MTPRGPFRELARTTNVPDIGREGRRMTRREFVWLAGGTAVAWPLIAQAQQQTGPIPRIAYLGASNPAIVTREIEQFKVGLTENGLIDGQNIKVDYLWGEGSFRSATATRYRPGRARSQCNCHGWAAAGTRIA